MFRQLSRVYSPITTSTYTPETINELVENYISNSRTKLKIVTSMTQPETRIMIPHNLIVSNPSEMFKKEWVGKPMIFKVDPSALIGHKRSFMKKYLIKNIYQENSSPNKLYTKMNPDQTLTKQQAEFDPQFFLSIDPDLQKHIKQGEEKRLSSDESIDLFQQHAREKYQQEPARFFTRLQNQFNVPESYCWLIEEAVANENRIYFGGLNQFALRNLLTNALSLSEMKSIFVMSLHFASGLDTNEDSYSRIARQLIYIKHYDKIWKMENGALMALVRQLPGCAVVGPDYTLQTIEEYSIVKNAVKYSSTKNEEKLTGHILGVDTDTDKIEKNAILEVMLGRLWSRKYTNNRFPYLSDNYLELSEEDQQAVMNIYNENYAKYAKARKMFYYKKFGNERTK